MTINTSYPPSNFIKRNRKWKSLPKKNFNLFIPRLLLFMLLFLCTMTFVITCLTPVIFVAKDVYCYMPKNVCCYMPKNVCCYMPKSTHFLGAFYDRIIGSVTSCVGAVFWNTLSKRIYKEVYRWWEDKKEDVSSYWLTLRKLEDAGNWKRKHKIALYEELALERG